MTRTVLNGSKKSPTVVQQLTAGQRVRPVGVAAPCPLLPTMTAPPLPPAQGSVASPKRRTLTVSMLYFYHHVSSWPETNK